MVSRVSTSDDHHSVTESAGTCLGPSKSIRTMEGKEGKVEEWHVPTTCVPSRRTCEQKSRRWYFYGPPNQPVSRTTNANRPECLGDLSIGRDDDEGRVESANTWRSKKACWPRRQARSILGCEIQHLYFFLPPKRPHPTPSPRPRQNKRYLLWLKAICSTFSAPTSCMMDSNVKNDLGQLVNVA